MSCNCSSRRGDLFGGHPVCLRAGHGAPGSLPSGGFCIPGPAGFGPGLLIGRLLLAFAVEQNAYRAHNREADKRDPDSPLPNGCAVDSARNGQCEESPASDQAAHLDELVAPEQFGLKCLLIRLELVAVRLLALGHREDSFGAVLYDPIESGEMLR